MMRMWTKRRWWSWGMRDVCRHAGGCSFAGLRCCHRGKDGGHLLGLWVWGKQLQGPGCDPAVWVAVVVGSGVWRRRGAAVSTV